MITKTEGDNGKYIIMKNEFRIETDAVYIILKNRNKEVLGEAIIDLEDLAKLQELDVSWHTHFNKFTRTYYAKATKMFYNVEGKYTGKTYYLQNIIMNKLGEERIDHISNLETLDCRKNNLRRFTIQENALHRKGANSNNKTGVRNVHYDKRTNTYTVQLRVNKKNNIFDKFVSLEEAALFAEKKRIELYGIEFR